MFTPDVRIWLILSIVVPTVVIIWYIFVGLSVYLAILIAAVGFGFAERGKAANKKLAIVGMVLNGILVALAVLMFVLILIA